MSEIWPYVAAIVPTILVATLFYFLIKSMIEGDRRERLAQSRFEAEQDRERDRTPGGATSSAGVSGAGGESAPPQGADERETPGKSPSES